MNWIEQHPVILSTFIWPLVSAILTALFKPRTPEQYSAMPARLAATLKFVGAIGLDVPNTVEALKQLGKNESKPAAEYRAEREP